jgi:hypothetical protein
MRRALGCTGRFRFQRQYGGIPMATAFERRMVRALATTTEEAAIADIHAWNCIFHCKQQQIQAPPSPNSPRERRPARPAIARGYANRGDTR